jgi:hypothetical protein
MTRMRFISRAIIVDDDKNLTDGEKVTRCVLM